MKHLLLPLAAVAMLSACSTLPSLGEAATAESREFDKISKQFEKGENMIEDGENKVARGEKLIKDGKKMQVKGQRLVDEAELKFEMKKP